MREDQNNSEYGHFSRSVLKNICERLPLSVCLTFNLRVLSREIVDFATPNTQLKFVDECFSEKSIFFCKYFEYTDAERFNEAIEITQ